MELNEIQKANNDVRVKAVFYDDKATTQSHKKYKAIVKDFIDGKPMSLTGINVTMELLSMVQEPQIYSDAAVLPKAVQLVGTAPWGTVLWTDSWRFIVPKNAPTNNKLWLQMAGFNTKDNSTAYVYSSDIVIGTVVNENNALRARLGITTLPNVVQMQMDIDALKNKVFSAEEVNARLKFLISKLRASLNDHEAHRKNDAALEQHIAELTKQLEDEKAELEKVRKEHAAEMLLSGTSKSNREIELAKEVERLLQSIADLEKALEEGRSARDLLKQQIMKWLDEAAKARIAENNEKLKLKTAEEELAEARAEAAKCKSENEAMQQQHDAVMSELNGAKDSLRLANEKTNGLEIQIETLKNSASKESFDKSEALRAEHEKALAQHKADIDALRNEIHQKSEAHATEMKAYKDKWDAEHEREMETRVKEIAARDATRQQMEEAHEREIEALREQHRNNAAALENTIREMKIELDNAKASIQKEVDKLVADMEKQLQKELDSTEQLKLQLDAAHKAKAESDEALLRAEKIITGV